MDFVYELPNNLSDEKCEEMIKRFEADDRKKRGVTLAEDDNEHKKSMDLHLSGLDEWKDMDEYLNQQLKIGLKEYMSHIIDSGYGNLQRFYSAADCHDSGYQIQKTVIGEYYSWHDDQSKNRSITFLWYLTTHDPINHGGGTAFHPLAGDGGKIVTPERGKLLLFPATWTYIHMGLPLYNGDPKYICTGWLHF